jgi:hypothetical protein
MLNKKKLKKVIKTFIFEKYEKYEYFTLEFLTNLTNSKNDSFSNFKKKLLIAKNKLDSLVLKNKIDDENFSNIYSSLIKMRKRVNNSNFQYKEFKEVLEKIDQINISLNYNEKDLLNLLKITTSDFKEKIDKKNKKCESSENSLLKSKNSSEDKKNKKKEESILLMEEDINEPTERLEKPGDSFKLLDDTLKDNTPTPEHNSNKSFIRFQNAHKIKNFSPITKNKQNFVKTNSMLNINNYSSIKNLKPRKISNSKASLNSINLKKTDLNLDEEIEIEIDTDLLKNDIYSKVNKKDPSMNDQTIYSKIKNSRSRNNIIKRNTLVLPNKSNMGSLSRKQSMNKNESSYFKTHYNNLKSEYVGQVINEDQFKTIIQKEIHKKSQRVDFHNNHFVCDVIKELKSIFHHPLQNLITFDFRRNNIDYSSDVEEDIEELKSLNIKIII